MPYKGNEITILFNETEQDGYNIQLSSLKELNESFKGYKIRVKRISNGRPRRGVICYEWCPREEEAEQIYNLYIGVIWENIQHLPNRHMWMFSEHPLKFIMRHRN